LAELTQEAIDALNNFGKNFKGAKGNSGSDGNEKASMSFNKAAIKSSEDLIKFGANVFGSGARVSDGFNAVTSIVGNFGAAALGAGTTIGAIGDIMAKGGGELIKAAEGAVDTYRGLSQSGASFNNNILEMKNAAAQSRLTLDEFAGVVGKNTQGFAAMGGSVTKGAKIFEQQSQMMFDKGLATPLLNMGMSFADINEDLAEYMVMNRRRFTEEQIASGAAAKASAAMSTEMDKIAKITGQNRKEMEKEVADRMRKGQVDAKIRMLEASGNKEAADKMKLALAEASKAGPGALAAVEDLFTKGAVVSEEGRSAAVALGPAFNDLTNMVNVAKGPQGIDGMRSSISTFNSAVAQRVQDPNFLQMATLGGMGNGMADAAAGLVVSAGTYSDNVKKLTDSGLTLQQAQDKLRKDAEDEQKKRDGATSTIINGEKALRDLGAIVNDKLIGPNGAFTKLSDSLLPLATKLENANRIDMQAPFDKIAAAADTVSVAAGGNVSMTPGVDPASIKATEATMADMKTILSKVADGGGQKTEAAALAAALGSSIGPEMAAALRENADKYHGGDIAAQIQSLLKAGSDPNEVAKMGEKIAGDKFGAEQGKIIGDSLRNAVALPLEELLTTSSITVDKMTVVASNLDLGQREFGGPVEAGKPYIVGEKRPEIFVPESSGKILPDASKMESVASASNMKRITAPQQPQIDITSMANAMVSGIGPLISNLENAMKTIGGQENSKELLDMLNNNMLAQTDLLSQGVKTASRQLKATGGLAGDIFKGFG
tara:strand:+ start:2240 stop:4558 length:2319 start_codon:yes stop_codon:yes gene_type:complete